MKQEKRTLSPKRFLLSFAALSLAVLVLMGAFVYFYDPYLYYRYEPGRLVVNNYRFVNPGIAKNEEYDAVLLGSSMTQNFDLPLMREVLGVDPVKLTVGGMSVEGMQLTLDLVERQGKAKTLYVCLDLPSLNKGADSLSSYATYLYDDETLNDVKYLCGYETWMRLLPLNLGFSALSAAGVDLPASYATRDLDTIGAWHEDARYGAEYLRREYLKKVRTYVQKTAPDESALPRMKENADRILELLFSLEDCEIVLFFPPYSQIFWNWADLDGLWESYFAVKSYIASRVEKRENVTLHDFQSMEETADLDLYKDYTHYSKELNDRMVYAFASGEWQVTPEREEALCAALTERYRSFCAENGDWLLGA